MKDIFPLKCFIFDCNLYFPVYLYGDVFFFFCKIASEIIAFRMSEIQYLQFFSLQMRFVDCRRSNFLHSDTSLNDLGKLQVFSFEITFSQR